MNRHPEQSGYVLVAMLVISIVIASVTLGHARHAILSSKTSESSMRVQRVEDAAASALAYAKEAMRTGWEGSADLDLGDGSQMTVGVAASDGDVRSLSIAASGDGAATVVTGSAQISALAGEPLPSLTDAARTAVLTVPAGERRIFSSSASISDTTLDGLVIVRNGVTLTLEDVVVNGTIISEPMIGATPWTDADRTALVVTGGLLVQPGSRLPGCAILMSDGSIVADADARTQLHGVVIANDVEMDGIGALHGDLVTATPPVLGAGIDTPGAGREPRAMPSPLKVGAASLSRVWFPRPAPSADEISNIRDFAFPALSNGEFQGQQAELEDDE